MLDLLTTAEAAERLGVAPQTVLNWVRSGRIEPAGKLPSPTGTYLFHPDAVAALVAEERESA